MCYDENGLYSFNAKKIAKELGISDRKVYKVKTKAMKKLSTNLKLQSYNENSI